VEIRMLFGRGRGGLKVALRESRAPMKQEGRWDESCFAWKSCVHEAEG